MNLKGRIEAFVKLGELLEAFSKEGRGIKPTDHTKSSILGKLDECIKTAHNRNGWFTEDNIRYALGCVAGMLSEEKLSDWVEGYKDGLKNTGDPLRIGVVMAGNIPLVGFHDFLCVLISGNVFVGKLSGKDDKLLTYLADVLISIEPAMGKHIEFTDGNLKGQDAIIATGSDNTSRYFEYYFGKYPNIIRKNRNSLAVLDGSETKEDLNKLSRDIFQYYGLGCRNVSKLMVPRVYDFDIFFSAIKDYHYVLANNKYANNYDYYKAIFLMNGEKLIENGFLILRENTALSSQVATLNYEYYTDSSTLFNNLKAGRNELQCVVSRRNDIHGCIPFGTAQEPGLSDYADGIDTMRFLLTL